jgi:glycosyltransferase involved in cell wall biosynthesis
MTPRSITVGIDAANLRRGGGVTHLVELLQAADPLEQGIGKVIVWSGRSTIERLPNRPWLELVCPPELDRGLLTRTYWQSTQLAREARTRGCDVIFAPGGSYSARFGPAVTMSQNLLPFEWNELRRYGVSKMGAKLLLLRFVQARSFRRSQGVIFLTDYARRAVGRVTGPLPGQTTKISHGIAPRFLIPPREPRGAGLPIRVIYVSIVDVYKHQWNVVSAVQLLRSQGHDIELDLVGPAYPPALATLSRSMEALPTDTNWVRYRGEVPYSSVHEAYRDADIAVFASSCENQPIILLEMMAAGLPVACSNRGPMPEILGEAGRYFDPDSPDEIAQSIGELSASPLLRRQLAQQSFDIAKRYSWSTTAKDTFDFLKSVARGRELLDIEEIGR